MAWTAPSMQAVPMPRVIISNPSEEAEQGLQAPGRVRLTPAQKRDETSQRKAVGVNFNKTLTPDSRPRFEEDPSIIKTLKFADLMNVHNAEFELTEGDTLVLVDYDFYDNDNDKVRTTRKSMVDCMKFAYRSQRFRVSSEKLLATGSSKFAEMLGPSYQFRVQRRRKLVNKLPDGVKYVLDLTPPIEGDELVFQMTELSLSPGIIKWWTSAVLHDVDKNLVNGHDDVCSCAQPSSQAPTTSSLEALMHGHKVSGQPANARLLSPSRLLEAKEAGRTEVYDVPHFRKIPDYCRFRHRSNIIRLLMMIQGKHTVRIDSAPRIWTLVGLSKIFDCTSVMQEPVVEWITRGTNTRFIEVLPEEALKLGFTLELPQVTQSAFRILVNEMALKIAAPQEWLDKQPRNVTVFGRKEGDTGDELKNLIQHAARALVDRVSSSIAMIRNPDMITFLEIPEWQRLDLLESRLREEDADITLEARQRLKHLREAIHHKILAKFEEIDRDDKSLSNVTYDTIDHDLATYVEPKNFRPIAEIMREMNFTQKLLLAFAYHDLGSKWSIPLVNGRMSEHDATKGHFYSMLVTSLGDSLDEIMIAIPGLRSDERWKAFLRQPMQVRDTGLFHGRVVRPIVDLAQLDREICQELRPLASCWIRHDIDPPLNLTRHLLLSFGHNEMKYLPLWAGGNDDGTGGVFESFLPPAVMGPNGPGPAYHTGQTIPSGPPSMSDSLMEEIGRMHIQGSTTAGSVDVHDSISTVYRPDEVIADDHSIASEAIDSDTGEYKDARFAVPADHQAMGQTIEMLVEAVSGDSDSESGSDSTIGDSESQMGDAESEADKTGTPSEASHDDVMSDDSLVIV